MNFTSKIYTTKRRANLLFILPKLINSVVCLTTCPQPLPKRAHRVRCSAFSFIFHYPFFSLTSSISCLRLLRLTVTFYPSVTCFKRQSLHKIWPLELAFLLFVVCGIFISSLTLCDSLFPTRSVQLISILLQHHISKFSGLRPKI